MRPLFGLLLISLAGLCSQMAAQTSLAGRTIDASGAAVPGVKLKLTCEGRERLTTSSQKGEYLFENSPVSPCVLEASASGFQLWKMAIEPQAELAQPVRKLDITLQVGNVSESVMVGSGGGFGAGFGGGRGGGAYKVGGGSYNTESYRAITENSFKSVAKNPLSTFSADADTASFTNTRRFLREGKLPPRDAVRVEEYLNYFRYSLPAPEGKDPLRITTELAACPWHPQHQLLFLGLKTREMAAAALPPANLVFLIDVSGSMNDPHKLPLLKQSFRLLVEQLRPQDQVAIVVYAGASGLALPTTKGSEKQRVLDVIQNLQPQGSTHGAAGIQLAYRIAQESFVPGGNNRIILATDGDFNVGVSGDSELVRLIEEKRKSGVFLTILGYGMGNYKDGKLEQIANAGNGNFAYIDNLLEARKFLVREMGQNLLTVAKDVKLQVEFNPEHVAEYRLIGYENRLLNAEDFKDDKKDAGELGSGHSVVALYELMPKGAPGEAGSIDKLRYQREFKATAKKSPEALFVKARYKLPDSQVSTEISQPVLAKPVANPSANLRFAAAVAQFGMVLSESSNKGNSTLENALWLAQQSLSEYTDEYRAAFPAMIERAIELKKR